MDWETDYDRWKTTPSEPEFSGYCNHCSQDIQKGEVIYVLDDGDTVHDDCFLEYAKSTLSIEDYTGANCEKCGEHVSDDEESYIVDGDVVHGDCFEEYAKQRFDARQVQAGED